jgi:glucose/arabinose dehydrogenase
MMVRKWYRAWPAVLAVGAVVAAVGLPRVLGQAGGGAAVERKSVKALNLPEALPVATGYTAVDAFKTESKAGLVFSQPLSVVAAPGETDRLFVLSKTGTIDVITDLEGKQGGPKKSTFMDLTPYLRKKGWGLGEAVEWGLLGMAFHPNFKENGYFYITYNPTVPEKGRAVGFDRVSRFSVSKTNPNEADMTSELPLITQLDEAPNHNGGCIKFGADGYLYFSNGDEGNANDSYDNARFVDKDFFAAIYRIDVDCKPGNLEPNAHAQQSLTFPSAVNVVEGKAAYRVPADNPLVGIKEYFGKAVDPAKVRTEIYANGLRNTWRFSFDDATGRLFAAEVGQDLHEEVDLIEKGGNYGWSYRESFHDGPRVKSTPAGAAFKEPIYEYGHRRVQRDNFAGDSISGGFVYRGTKFAELTGAYIFGDYVSGRVWALKEKEGKWTPQLLASNVGVPVEFSADPRNGDILFCDIGELRPGAVGRVARLVRTGVQGPKPPALLSQVGAFKDLKTLEPAEGMVAYEPNVSFWSDYALKSRWFMVPRASATIGFDATGNWKFPAGMVWVKHFDMEMTRGDVGTKRRLETRFIVKNGGGVYGITYRWRPDGTDADLVPEGGMDEELTINEGGKARKQLWHYPSQSECLSCHSAVTGGVLGMNTWQMNGKGEGRENQIEMMRRMGYFSAQTPVPEVKTLGAYAKADDASASLEWRVRSYLGANCVQCHQPGGVVQGLFDVRPTTPLDATHLIEGALGSSRGDDAARVLAPGDLVHSMMLRRVQGDGVPRMPPLATYERDLADEELLKAYIGSLKK